MKVVTLAVYVCFIGLLVSTANAREVMLQHRGLTLNAELQWVADKINNERVILITHGALAHRGMEIIRYLQALLKERQYNSLAINLSLGVNNRQGMYDCKQIHRHRNEDAIDEIQAWLSWLKIKGVTRVTLLGHSRGGAQTALFAVDNNDPIVDSIILLAPATTDNSSAASYTERYKLSLPPLLNKAEILVHTNQGNTLLKHVGLMTCPDTTATAQTFLSYYKNDRRLDTINLIKQLKTPALIVVAGEDSIVVDLDRKLTSILPHRYVQMTVIDGAGHMFRDLFADEAADAIDSFIQHSTSIQMQSGFSK